MSPRRKVKHAAVHRRSTRDYLYALGAVAGVLAVTAITIWLIRPGGAASDQPRIATVLFGSVCVFLMAWFITSQPDRPVVGRGVLWSTIAFLAVAIVSIGAILDEAVGWKHALRISLFVAGGLIVVAALGELMLLMRHWAQGNRPVGTLLSVALALIVGAIAALGWPGGLKIERPPSAPASIPGVPSTVPAVVDPAATSTPSSTP